MRFRNDEQRKAVFASMFDGGSSKNFRVSSNYVKNFEVKSTKTIRTSRIKGLGRFERSRMPYTIKPKKVRLKSPLFPPSVIRRRIDATINFFFDDLEEYSNKIGLKTTPMKKTGENKWENNIVKVKIIDTYNDNRPRTFRITYNVVSFIGQTPRERDGLNKEKMIDKYATKRLSSKHVVEIGIPKKYPDQLGNCTTKFLTTSWIATYGQIKGGICLHVNGEIDRVIMHLMQQLLWEPSHDLRSRLKAENNTKKMDEVNNYLIEKTKELHK